MSRSSLSRIDCSVAQSLEILGEWWTLMILRNAFHGMRTFDAFRQNLEMSTSVLSARLKKLTDAGILERRQSDADGRSFEYRLTERGFDLYPVVVGLMQWGEKWFPNGRGRRIELREKSSGQPIAGARVVTHDGRPVKAWEVEVIPGPGADSRMLALMRDPVGK